MLAMKDKISLKVVLTTLVESVQLENIKRLVALISVQIVLQENINTMQDKQVASPAERAITVQKVMSIKSNANRTHLHWTAPELALVVLQTLMVAKEVEVIANVEQDISKHPQVPLQVRRANNV